MNKEALVELHQQLSGYHDFLFERFRDITVPEMQDVKRVLELVEKIVAEIPGPIISAAGNAGTMTKVENFANLVVGAPPATEDGRKAFMRLGELLAAETPMNMGYVLVAKEQNGLMYYVSTFAPQMSRQVLEEFIRHTGGQL